MTGRALTLALRLLCTTAAAAAVVTLPGCWCVGHDPWEDTQTLELETDADLHAVVRVSNEFDDADDRYVGLAVGAGGSVIAWGEDYDDTTYQPIPFVEHSQVGDVDLRGAWAGGSAWWVVGDAGMAAVSLDRGTTWTSVDLGTAANLRGITSLGSRMLVVGDGVVLVQDLDGSWLEVAAPTGDWGELRAVHFDGSRVWVVGLAGTIWSAEDPSGEWMAEDVGTDVDLFDVAAYASYHYGDEPTLAVVGAAGTLLVRGTSGWSRADTRVSVDLLAYEDGVVLAAGGGLYELRKKDRLRHIATLERASAMTFDDYGGVFAVGPDGVAYTKPFYVCEGGRPFVVDGNSLTASIREGAPSDSRSEIEAELARAWTEDGLIEHASVASFARFALELLALGAPPALLREVQVAIADELRHTELCLGLARRFGGSAIELGALPVPAGVLARVGDPIATALALFEEGCVNESLAACEAADAAGACEDAEVREVLETIAADERRHATLAWGALRWLIDAHGERVRAPLRARLARLESRTCSADGEFDPRLVAWGRLSPARRAQVHRRVMSELVSPLARALLVHEAAQPQEVA